MTMHFPDRSADWPSLEEELQVLKASDYRLEDRLLPGHRCCRTIRGSGCARDLQVRLPRRGL